MIVCLCHGVTSLQLEHVVKAGADTVEAVGRRCGAGTDCGACIDHIEDVLESRGQQGAPCTARRLPMADHAA